MQTFITEYYKEKAKKRDRKMLIGMCIILLFGLILIIAGA